MALKDKQQRAEYNKKYYLLNQEKHKEKMKIYSVKYEEENKEAIKKRRKEKRDQIKLLKNLVSINDFTVEDNEVNEIIKFEEKELLESENIVYVKPDYLGKI